MTAATKVADADAGLTDSSSAAGIVTRVIDGGPASTVGYLQRVGWTVVAMLVAFSGERVWGGSTVVPGANLTAIALIAVGLVGIWYAWFHSGDLPRVVQMLLLAALTVGLTYHAIMMWIVDPAYGTDAAAFDQYAASLAMHGHNPYTQSMEPSLTMFHVPVLFHTYRLDGTAVTALSYPAGSFLPYIPWLAIASSWQAANIVDMLFWVAGMLLMWRMLPRDVCWISAVIGAATMYFGFMAGGLTDALFVPFTLLAVYKWDRFADTDIAGWRKWIGPLALGAAMSVKQTPWFLLPFLVLGIVFEARARGINPARTAARYIAAVFGVFVLLNAPWLLASPSAWLRGTVVPFLDPTIPDGQGLINLAVFHGIGGGNLSLYTVLAGLFMLFALAAFMLRYERMKRAWVPLIGIAFFLPTRSFGSYLFMMIPAAIVAGVTVRTATANPFPRLSRHAGRILAAAGLAVVGSGVFALTRPAPLTITVVGTRSTGQLQTLDQVTVRVTNRTGNTVRPHFTVNSSGHATSFWYVMNEHGLTDVAVRAHQSVTLMLQAPNTASMPSLTAPMEVEAYTAKPASVSVSRKYLVSPTGTRIIPDSVNRPVPAGVPVQVKVQAETQYGSPLRKAGIPITLNQTVYGQDGILAGESAINGHREGFSPVVASTDADGVATFTVVGNQAQSAPVYYQAWIADGVVPHGYSNMLSIRYVK